MNQTKTRPTMILTTGLLAIALMFALAPVQAHGGNHGTIKVHDNEEADPDQRNEPHVDCDFWIEGFNMHDSSGSIVVYSWPPTGDKSQVMDDTWTGTLEDDDDGYHFLSGPYMLPSGHYRVEAFADAGHPGGHDHFAKAKMFWVHCGDEQPPEECPPTDLGAMAHDGGSIELTFSAPDGATGLNIYRATGAGDFEYLDTVDADATSYLDSNTTIGTSYTYTVHPLFGHVEAQDCEEVVVTAIPVFPSAIVAGLAAVLGVLGYAFVGRRR